MLHLLVAHNWYRVLPLDSSINPVRNPEVNETASSRLLADANGLFHKAEKAIEEHPAEAIGAAVVSAAAVGTFIYSKGKIGKPIATEVLDDQAVLTFLKTEPPASMREKAYKVLSASGRSPWCNREKWPLPKQQSDGTFLPGDWVEAKPRLTLASIIHDHQPGLYVASDPRWWWLKDKSRVVYEAEIGDSFPLAHWHSLPAIDFVAQKVRLLRPMPTEVIAKFGEQNPFFKGAYGIRLPFPEDIKSGRLPIKIWDVDK